MMMRDGTQDILESDDPRVKRLYKDESLKVYNFFRDEFFGIEKTIAQIVRYFHSASLKGEESRQVLYLMGPVGSGKSSLVEKLQRGLEAVRARSTPSTAARCTRSRCISCRATCARSSRRCSACTSRATSARCAASA